MPVTSTSRDFKAKFAFTVEIQGVSYAGFKTCSEIGASIEGIDHREGGAPLPQRDLGLVTYRDVTLERGATDENHLWEWWQEHVDAAKYGGSADAHKRQADVVEWTRLKTAVRGRWRLLNCFLVDFTASGGYDSEANENAMEKIVLRYDSFEKV